MQQHCKSAHKWVNSNKRGGDVRAKAAQTRIVPWESCDCCQTFFRNNLWIRFFKVNPKTTQLLGLKRDDPREQPRASTSEKDTISLHILSTLESKEEAYHLSCQKISDQGQTRFDASPWLEMMRWTKYVDGHALATLAPLAYLPDPTKEPFLFQLGESLDRVVEQAYESICQDKMRSRNYIGDGLTICYGLRIRQPYSNNVNLGINDLIINGHPLNHRLVILGKMAPIRLAVPGIELWTRVLAAQVSLPLT
jgi:hypothetical protein